MKVICIEDLKIDDRVQRTATRHAEGIALAARQPGPQRRVTPGDVSLAPRISRVKLLIASISCFLVATALFGWLMEPSIERWLVPVMK